jgi:signal transduction histidine kinase
MQQKSLFAIVSRSLALYSILVSVVFLIGIVSLYRARLQEQRFDAAVRINLLLQVSLENAMLKRDIPGLMEIVERLGKQTGIEAVMILNPQGEVRFASRPDLVSRRFDLAKGQLCPECAWDGKGAIDRSDLLDKGVEGTEPVLRSIKSVANRTECGQCHGSVATSPVNGLLVVDHNARDLKQNALLGALVLAGAGLLVVFGLVVGIYHTLRRNVLTPLTQLTAASADLAGGNLDRRVALAGASEITDLGQSFNDMASRLQHSLARLGERERFVQALLETLPDGVRVIDENFRIVLTNEAYRQQLRLEQAPAPGTFCYGSSHGRAEPCVPTLVTCPLHALRGETRRIKFQAHHIRADGSEMSVEVNAARVTLDGPDAGRKLVIEVIRDLDAQLQISHEQRLSELGQLATGVAHEIRNPLSSVAILLAEAELNLREGAAFESESWLHLIDQEIQRCLAITDSLLKLGTPPASEPELILLNEIVRDILRLLSFQAGETHVAINTSMEDGLRVLGADNDLRIVMINLIQNAFHAMPDGGQLSIQAGRSDKGMITITISDTGVGIPPEHIPFIFLPFWSRRADGVHGTGLGLSICRSIIRTLGGEIRVSSTLGRGTIFSLFLPDADRETETENGR